MQCETIDWLGQIGCACALTARPFNDTFLSNIARLAKCKATSVCSNTSARVLQGRKQHTELRSVAHDAFAIRPGAPVNGEIQIANDALSRRTVLEVALSTALNT